MSKQQKLDEFFKKPQSFQNSQIPTTSSAINNTVPSTSSSKSNLIVAPSRRRKKKNIDVRQKFIIKNKVSLDDFRFYSNMTEIIKNKFIIKYPDDNDAQISFKVENELRNYYVRLLNEHNFLTKYKHYFTDFHIQPKPWLTVLDKIECKKYNLKQLKVNIYERNVMHEYNLLRTKIKKLQGRSVDSINLDINIKTQRYFNKILRNEGKGNFDKTVKLIRHMVYQQNNKCLIEKDYFRNKYLKDSSSCGKIAEVPVEVIKASNTIEDTDICNCEIINISNSQQRTSGISNKNDEKLKNDIQNRNQDISDYDQFGYISLDEVESDNRREQVLNEEILRVLPNIGKQVLNRVKEKFKQKLLNIVNIGPSTPRMFKYCRRKNYTASTDFSNKINTIPEPELLAGIEEDEVEKNLSMAEFLEKTNILELMENLIKEKEPIDMGYHLENVEAYAIKCYITRYKRNKPLPKNFKMLKSDNKNRNESAGTSIASSVDTVIFNPQHRNEPLQSFNVKCKDNNKPKDAAADSIVQNVNKVHQPDISDETQVPSNAEVKKASQKCIDQNVISSGKSNINKKNCGSTEIFFRHSDRGEVSEDEIQKSDDSYLNKPAESKKKLLAKKMLEFALNSQCFDNSSLILPSNSEESPGPINHKNVESQQSEEVILETENYSLETSNSQNETISQIQSSVDPLIVTNTPNEAYLYYDILPQPINNENKNDISINENKENITNLNDAKFKNELALLDDIIVIDKDMDVENIDSAGMINEMESNEYSKTNNSTQIIETVKSPKNTNLLNNITESQSLIPKEVGLSDKCMIADIKKNDDIAEISKDVKVDKNNLEILKNKHKENDPIYLLPRRKRKSIQKSSTIMDKKLSHANVTENEICSSSYNRDIDPLPCIKSSPIPIYSSDLATLNSILEQHPINHVTLSQQSIHENDSKSNNTVIPTTATHENFINEELINENCDQNLKIKTELLNYSNYSQDVEFIPIKKYIVLIDDDDDNMDTEEMIYQMGIDDKSNSINCSKNPRNKDEILFKDSDFEKNNSESTSIIPTEEGLSYATKNVLKCVDTDKKTCKRKDQKKSIIKSKVFKKLNPNESFAPQTKHDFSPLELISEDSTNSTLTKKALKTKQMIFMQPKHQTTNVVHCNNNIEDFTQIIEECDQNLPDVIHNSLPLAVDHLGIERNLQTCLNEMNKKKGIQINQQIRNKPADSKKKLLAKKMLEFALNSQCFDNSTLILPSNSEESPGAINLNNVESQQSEEVILENYSLETSNTQHDNISQIQSSVDPLIVTNTPNEAYVYYDILAQQINNENKNDISINENKENITNLNDAKFKNELALLGDIIVIDKDMDVENIDSAGMINEMENNEYSKTTNSTQIIETVKSPKNTNLLNNITESESLIPKEVGLPDKCVIADIKKNDDIAEISKDVKVDKNNLEILKNKHKENDPIYVLSRRKRKSIQKSSTIMDKKLSHANVNENEICSSSYNRDIDPLPCIKSSPIPIYSSDLATLNSILEQHPINHVTLSQQSIHENDSKSNNTVIPTTATHENFINEELINENCDQNLKIKTELLNYSNYSQDVEFIPVKKYIILIDDDDDNMDTEEMIYQMGIDDNSNSINCSKNPRNKDEILFKDSDFEKNNSESTSIIPTEEGLSYATKNVLKCVDTDKKTCKRKNQKISIIKSKVFKKLNPNESFAPQTKHDFSPLELISEDSTNSTLTKKALKTMISMQSKHQITNVVHCNNNIEDFSQIIEECDQNLPDVIHNSLSLAVDHLGIERNLQTCLNEMNKTKGIQMILPELDNQSSQLCLSNPTNSQLLNIDTTFFNSSQLLMTPHSTNVSSLKNYKNLAEPITCHKTENFVKNIQSPTEQIQSYQYGYITYLSLTSLFFSRKKYDVKYKSKIPFLEADVENELIKATIHLSRNMTKKNVLCFKGKNLNVKLGINNQNWSDIKQVLYFIKNFVYNCYESPTDNSLLYLILHYFFKTLPTFVQITYHVKSPNQIDCTQHFHIYEPPIKNLSKTLDIRILKCITIRRNTKNLQV